jgi:hypothetical protein
MQTGMRQGRSCLFCTLLLVVSGCGRWPPVVDTADDVRRLPVSEPSVRARGLRDSDIPSLARLHDLRILDFAGGMAVKEAEITNAGLARLAKLDLPKLETLNLGWNNNITDAGLDSICQMHTISLLLLPACPNITDAGLQKLTKAKNVTYLDLRGCPGITDAGIQQLAAKTHWKQIELGGCPNVTAQGVAKLQAALPNARIDKNDQEWELHRKQGKNGR